MQNLYSETNGLEENHGAYSVEELLAAMSHTQYRRIIGYARLRLRAAAGTRWLQRFLAATDAEDLVHQALLKLLLGEQDPALGRHLKSGKYRVQPGRVRRLHQGSRQQRESSPIRGNSARPVPALFDWRSGCGTRGGGSGGGARPARHLVAPRPAPALFPTAL